MPKELAGEIYAQYGILAVVLFWLMRLVEKKLDLLIKIVTKLVKAIALLTKSIEHLDRDKREDNS